MIFCPYIVVHSFIPKLSITLMRKSTLSVLFLLLAHTILLAQSSITQQSVMRWNGKGDFSDRFKCVKVDGNGDIVAAGYTVRNDSKRDIFVAKFGSATGSLVWTFVYNGLDNGDDEVNAMTLDGNNNIYIVGVVDNDATNDDVFTAKISAAGVLQWKQTYNYPQANEDDEGRHIALTNDNFVLVTGSSNSSSLDTTLNDFITLKYDNNGAQQWVTRFNGAANGSDEAERVASDANGDIFVLGRSYNGNDDDYATIKYNSAGVQQWLKIADRGKNDRPTDMALDAAGNCYVTGRSKLITFDYHTIKYNSSGTVVWTHTFNNSNEDRAISIAVDANQNVYVCGESIAGTQLNNFHTIKISANGTNAWLNAVYNHSANRDDLPVGMTIDAAGNVYVTGNVSINPTTTHIATLKYDTNGQQQWVAIYDNNGSANKSCEVSAIALNAQGNVFVVGYKEDGNGQRSALLMNYQNSGAVAWESGFEGGGDNADNIRAMAADASGNLYLAGYTNYKLQNRNTLLIKTNANGDTLWSRTLNGSSNRDDEWASVAIDPSGNIIVGGFMRLSGRNFDYFVAKYNANGDTLWTRAYNGAQSKSDKAADMALDAAGNIYLTGRTDNGVTPTTNYDMLTLKYNNNGALQWAKSYSSAGNIEDRGEKICVSPAGEVYAIGRIGVSATNNDVFVIKYDTNGTPQWTKSKGGTSNENDAPNDALFANNHLFVTGKLTNNLSLDDIFTMKLDANGGEVWTKVYDNAGKMDVGAALCRDNGGNVMVAAYSAFPASGLSEMVLLRYIDNGTEEWVKTYTASGSNYNVADDITTDAAGNILVAAHTEKSGSLWQNPDFRLLAYDGMGNLLATADYNGTGDSTDIPTNIFVNGGQIYIVGGSWGGVSQRDVALLRFNATLLGLAESHSYAGLSLYPNPASETLNISDKNGLVTEFRLYNNLGVEVLRAAPVQNSLDISQLPAGIYLYQALKDGDLLGSGKLMKE